MTKHLTIDGKYQREKFYALCEDNRENIGSPFFPMITTRLMDSEYSWNNFFDCPICGKYRFRVCMNFYRLHYWEDIDFNCLCLNCNFSYKKNLSCVDIDEYDFDPIDFITDYFKNQDLKVNDECLEYLVNSISKTPRYQITESQTTLKDFVKEVEK